jgi:hypothetical protein
MMPRGFISGTGVLGRGVPPSAIENAIIYGASAPGKTPDTIIYTYENIVVAWSTTLQQVITVINKDLSWNSVFPWGK